MDMVRLGIGLYGFAATNNEQQQLQHVATQTTISQIKSVPSNETIGYSRKGKLTRDSLIATVAIGYADGINRRLGNGVGSMLVNGKKRQSSAMCAWTCVCLTSPIFQQKKGMKWSYGRCRSNSYGNCKPTSELYLWNFSRSFAESKTNLLSGINSYRKRGILLKFLTLPAFHIHHIRKVDLKSTCRTSKVGKIRMYSDRNWYPSRPCCIPKRARKNCCVFVPVKSAKRKYASFL